MNAPATPQRGFYGTTPRAGSLDEESYLDFQAGIRTFGMGTLTKAFKGLADRKFADYSAEHGSPPKNFDEARQALEDSPLVQFRNRLMRSSQELKYDAATDAFNKYAAHFGPELEAGAAAGPGTLTLDPDFVAPEYYSSVEFHIKPGNYDGQSLAGLQYHYTMNLFTGFGRHSDDSNRGYVKHVPTPDDGRVEKILDLACSIGQSATALKERFPDAEVHAIDLAAPMLTYAAYRANKMNIPVHFSQQAAESLNYADGTFDLVYVYIIFHELPEGAADEVIKEAYRVLRPGGKFVIVDFHSIPENAQYSAQNYIDDWDGSFNGEPYRMDFQRSAFTARLEKVFDSVEERHEMPGHSDYIWMRVAKKSA